MRIRQLLLTASVIGATVVLTACGDDGTNPSPSGNSGPVATRAGTSVTSPPTAAPDAVSTGTPGPVGVERGSPSTAPDSPAPAGGTAVPTRDPGATTGTGEVVLRTVTVLGVAVPNVPVHLALFAPCDAAARDLAEDTPETRRWTGSTDADGRITFTVPVGCYRFGMTAPAGTHPVPEGMHTLFLPTAGQSVTGSLRFQDPTGSPQCAARDIGADLALGAPYGDAEATVRVCLGSWAVVAWDVPGDSQRIVRQVDSRWTTYVLFPHDRCWSAAQADGAPSALREYFTAC